MELFAALRDSFAEVLRHFFERHVNNLALLREHFTNLITGSSTMLSPVDSAHASECEDTTKSRMKHVKTKEECRLGNETTQVWTVELPSKHAEGVLK